MPKRRENDPKRKVDFAKMGKALGYHSYDTGLGGISLFSGDSPNDSSTVHRTSFGGPKGERFDPGKGHVNIQGADKTVIQGVAGISKKKSE
jgi:hypothetical protein